MAYSNAIFYVDLYNGNDAARTALTGCIASNPSGTITRITKAAHGLVTGAVVDLTLFTTWLNGAWKITVVDANSFDLDGAAWQATADANGTVTPRGGSSWADAWKTVTTGVTSARVQSNDEVRLSKTPDPVGIGSASWIKGSSTVTLASARTRTVSLCETAFTPATNVTASTVATRKQGSVAASLSTNAAFSTGLIGYQPLPTTLDLSAYQSLSFQFYASLAFASTQPFKICLCSDSAGAVVVDEFMLPLMAHSSRFSPYNLTRTGGGNLGSSINSIALYAVIDPGSLSIYLDCIIACKSNDLNLTSLISKNGLSQGGNEGYTAIQSINDTAVVLACANSTNAGSETPYFGDSETVEIYIRGAFTDGYRASTYYAFQINTSYNINYRGGFNPSNNLQDGETFFDGLNGTSYGFYHTSGRELSLENLSFFRFSYGAYISPTSKVTYSFNNLCNNESHGLYINGNLYTDSEIAGKFLNRNGGSGFFVNNGSFSKLSLCADMNLSYGISLGSGSYFYAPTIKARFNNNSGFSAVGGIHGLRIDYIEVIQSSSQSPLNIGSGYQWRILSGYIEGTSTANYLVTGGGIFYDVRLINITTNGMRIYRSAGGLITFINCNFTNAIGSSENVAVVYLSGGAAYINCTKNGAPLNHISRHTSSVYEFANFTNNAGQSFNAVKFSYSVANRIYEKFFKLAEVAVVANKVVTASVSLNLNQYNGPTTARLTTDYNPSIGVDPDVDYAEITLSSTVQDYSLQFTFIPSADGVAEVGLYFNGESTPIIYNLQISQSE